MRPALIAALASGVAGPVRSKIRKFLLGLSCDELEFIAEYAGACILDPGQQDGCSRTLLARSVAEFQQAREGCSCPSADQDHKMILLLEFLCRGGMRHKLLNPQSSAFSS